MGKPLVTISIITYNSSITVKETLDSVLSQDYPRIELIVSDDCSTDDTLDKCSDWILKHKDRFEGYRIIKSEKNTGVTANCNRASIGIRGEYLKLLAGDDLLAPNAISEYVNYMLSNPTAVYVFSRVKVFGENQESVRMFADNIFDYSFFSLSPEEQYRWLIGRLFNPIPAASAFVNVNNAISLGVLKYDESIPMLEDWPKWIILSEKGVAFHFIDKPLAYYRVGNESSICSGSINRQSFTKSKALLYLKYKHKPTIRLFGLRRAISLYIISMSRVKQHSIWSLLNVIVETVLSMRNYIREAFHPVNKE